jgi:hypothetical protein
MNSSNNLFEYFNKIRKSDWEIAALKELQGKTLETLNYAYHPDLVMPPVQFPDAIKQKIHPILWRKEPRTLCGILFPHAFSPDEKSLATWTQLNVKNFICGYSLENATLFLSMKEGFPLCNWYLENKNEIIAAGSDVLNLYLVESRETEGSAQVLDMMIQGIHLLNQAKEKGASITMSAEQICFSRIINDHFLYEIALGRAQRIIWRNLLHAYKIRNPKPPLFISTLRASNTSSHFLIEATSKIMSAHLAGSDHVYLRENPKNDPTDLHHAVHICNIMELEAGIGTTMDPVAGSYYLDELTSRITHQIWRALKS